ncbi:MAG: ribonuclease H-like domain-containing protein, partial [Methanobacterium sp.]
AALEAFVSHVDDDTVFVSFNGQTFDVPYIENRLKHHGLKQNIRRYHLDLLHFSRRTWKSKLPNCQLQTLEKYLFDFEREDDVPSSMVPSFYKTYDETGNIGPLIPIVEHNREDVITLARILSRLHTEMDI